MGTTRNTERAQLDWTAMAALLGFLSWILLLPGTSALQCYSYTSVQPVSRNKIDAELSVVPNNFSTCSSEQTSCVESLLLLRTEKMDMLVTHRGCSSGGLKDREEPATSGGRHFNIQPKVRYCQSSLCNKNLTDLTIFKRSEQDKALQASNSIQCYSGFVLDPDQDILDKVKCGNDSTQCYHGNATITAGHRSVHFLLKTCQLPSCNVSETQFFGPIELRLWGSCCHDALCNGEATAPQSQNASRAAALTSSPRDGDAFTQTTHFTQNIVNGTKGASSVPGEATVTPGPYRDTNTKSPTLRNPLYDYEETFDDLPFPDGSLNPLNPRARNVGHPKSSLPFYPLLVATGVAVFGIW